MSNVTQINTVAARASRFSRMDRPRADVPAESLSLDDSSLFVIHKKRGQSLHQYDDLSRSAYVIQDGWMGSSVLSRGGDRAFIALHFPGDLIGVADLLAGRQSCEMHALCDVSVRAISRSELTAQFEDPKTSLALATSLAHEIHAESSLLASFISGDARGRVAALALHIVERLVPAFSEEPITIATPLTQTDIADLTGITSVHVNRTIRTLREDGIFGWGGRSLNVPDPTRLKRFVTRQVCGQR